MSQLIKVQLKKQQQTLLVLKSIKTDLKYFLLIINFVKIDSGYKYYRIT